MKRLIPAAAVILLSLTLWGCQSQTRQNGQSTASQSTDEKKIAVSVTLTADQTTTKKDITTTLKTSLMDVMKDNFDVVEENGMITAIDGLAQNEQEKRYWVFTINGEQINTGAADTYLKEGDAVEFTYESF